MHGKAQLTKLQRTMDDLIGSIAAMEAEKTRKGRIQALSVGILSALVLGIGMCCTMVWTGLMAVGVVVGLIGIAGCVGAYFVYRRTCAKEAARINPRIEAAYATWPRQRRSPSRRPLAGLRGTPCPRIRY